MPPVTTSGVTGALSFNPVEYYVLVGCTAVAWAYAVELNVLIFTTFRRRSGLYFWSLLICSWGVCLHALAFILKFLVGASWTLTIPIVEIGWISMVTGQAFVLYSRLHLVVRNQKTLRLVLYMIIFDAFVLHIPTAVFTVGSNSPNSDHWTPMFNIMERIQLAGFCIQECVISGIYVWSTVRIMGSTNHRSTRRVLFQLILINSICIGMDIVLIGLEYSDQYSYEASIKPTIYAIKLRLEFAVLNQLLGLVKAGLPASIGAQGRPSQGNGALYSNGPDNPHQIQLGTWNITKAANNNNIKDNDNKYNSKNNNNRLSDSDLASTAQDNRIYRTREVKIVSEAADEPDIRIQYIPSSEIVDSEDRLRARSMMGSTAVFGSNNRHNSRGSYLKSHGRGQSPTESEKEIIGGG